MDLHDTIEVEDCLRRFACEILKAHGIEDPPPEPKEPDPMDSIEWWLDGYTKYIRDE